jgi:hypothetical protein
LSWTSGRIQLVSEPWSMRTIVAMLAPSNVNDRDNACSVSNGWQDKWSLTWEPRLRQFYHPRDCATRHRLAKRHNSK